MVEKNSYRIRLQIAEIDDLKSSSPYATEFKLWHDRTDALLMEIFGEQSHHRNSFQCIIYTPLFLSCRCSDTVFSDAFIEGLNEAGALLESLVEKVAG